MKLLPISATVLAVAFALANAASAQVANLPLPAPPAAANPAAGTIFDAMLSIARAAASDPAAAQQATYSYDAAVQQYNAGDYTRARQSALTAIGQTSAVPLPQPSLHPLIIPQPPYQAIHNVTSPDQADAEGDIALAHNAIASCGAPNATPPPAILQDYSTATTDLVERSYIPSRAASEDLINRCAAATHAYIAQQAALPQPSSTPIPMGTYSPVPLATLIPDPALQQAPAVMPTAAPTPAPARRGFHLF